MFDWGNSHVGVTYVLDCDIVVNEFELQTHYYVQFRTDTFGKGKNSFIPSVMGQIVPLLSFYKDGFNIKEPTKIDVHLNWRKDV